MAGFKQNKKYVGIGIAISLPSLFGIYYGIYHSPTDGARGGAITVALSFLLLFLRKNFGFYTQKRINETKPSGVTESDTSSSALQRQIHALSARLNVNDDGQSKLNMALAWTSCVGTITWGFGDLISNCIKALL